MLLVDDNGWVAHNSGIAVCERIAAPRADRALAIPGLGLCLPQPLTDGWLVRPSGTDQSVSAELNLTHAPTLEVSAGEQPWRSTLTNRHTEILLLLHAAGPAGLNAEQLSRGLYGDTAHVVTTRAEVSRLRRAFGALLQTQPCGKWRRYHRRPRPHRRRRRVRVRPVVEESRRARPRRWFESALSR